MHILNISINFEDPIRVLQLDDPVLHYYTYKFSPCEKKSLILSSLWTFCDRIFSVAFFFWLVEWGGVGEMEGRWRQKGPSRTVSKIKKKTVTDGNGVLSPKFVRSLKLSHFLSFFKREYCYISMMN